MLSTELSTITIPSLMFEQSNWQTILLVALQGAALMLFWNRWQKGPISCLNPTTLESYVDPSNHFRWVSKSESLGLLSWIMWGLVSPIQILSSVKREVHVAYIYLFTYFIPKAQEYVTYLIVGWCSLSPASSLWSWSWLAKQHPLDISPRPRRRSPWRLSLCRPSPTQTRPRGTRLGGSNLFMIGKSFFKYRK